MKPVNIVGTAQAQAMEISSLMGGGANNDDARRALSDANDRVVELTAQVQELTIGNAALTEQIDSLTATVDGLEKQLEDTSAKLAAAGANVDELNAEIAALKAATSKGKK